MSSKQNNSEQVQKIYNFIDTISFYFEQNKNRVIGGLVAVVLLLGGIFAYSSFIKAPKEEKAQNAIYMAQYLFSKDSFEVALKGNAQIKGFEKIAKDFGGTSVGNLAKFYAGICHLNLGKFKEATQYLEDFKTNDPLIKARKYGCLGDAYAEQKQMDKAIDNYKKAFEIDNEVTAPTYMYRAAFALDIMGKKSEALALLEQLNKTYPNSQEGQAAELVIGKLEQEVN